MQFYTVRSECGLRSECGFSPRDSDSATLLIIYNTSASPRNTVFVFLLSRTVRFALIIYQPQAFIFQETSLAVY